ncbi:hypothetical protein BDZ89DRAFT_1124796 [Hymenopellis radicata]|nr:hypothetical protein BDZ89DRAFT_1124796 [Hymenopellis radicata]
MVCSHFDPVRDLSDLTGKVIVTGANSGIGYSSLYLALKGAKAARNDEKAKAALERLHACGCQHMGTTLALPASFGRLFEDLLRTSGQMVEQLWEQSVDFLSGLGLLDRCTTRSSPFCVHTILINTRFPPVQLPTVNHASVRTPPVLFQRESDP